MSNSLAGSDYGTGQKKLSVYVIGVALCVLLTLLSFGVVMSGTFSRGQILQVIFWSAFLQFMTQVVCFLRLNAQTEQGKINIMCLLFAIFILAVVVGGSIWIMVNLNYNMMH